MSRTGRNAGPENMLMCMATGVGAVFGALLTVGFYTGNECAPGNPLMGSATLAYTILCVMVYNHAWTDSFGGVSIFNRLVMFARKTMRKRL